MVNKRDMIADLIEHSLSGQYGRDTAETIAQEILDHLALADPQKWETGVYDKQEKFTSWFRDFVYAETERSALEYAKACRSRFVIDERYDSVVRPYRLVRLNEHTEYKTELAEWYAIWERLKKENPSIPWQRQEPVLWKEMQEKFPWLLEFDGNA